MTNPATVSDLFTLIERSGLLLPETLDPYLDRADAGDADLATPEVAVRKLLRDQLLTPFQARQLLHGRYRGFFISEKYKVLDLLGEGGMGRVLLCEHLILHKLVAVKILHMTADPIPGAAERFIREARAAAGLDHPNIARVFDVDRGPAGPFMVMEYVDGTNLHQLVAQHGPLSVARAADYIRQAALGLQHAHEKGLVHRDIKPGNLIVDRDGLVKVLDLGLARFFDVKKNDNLTRRFDAQNVLGTADFIAPEQAMNSSNVDIRADLYSLGCTLYYTLLRKFPFEDGTVTQKLMWHQSRVPDPVTDFRPDVPESFAAVLAKLMAKDPNDRYATPEAAADALAPFCVAQLPPPPATEMPRIKPTSYTLGLCPAPPPSAIGDATTPSNMAPEAPTQIDSGRRGNPGTPASDPHRRRVRTPSSHAPDPASDILTKRYVEPPLTRRSRFRFFALAACAVLVGAALSALVRQLWVPSSAGETRPTAFALAPVPSTGVVLKAGGSTFVKPMMEVWSSEYEAATGIKIEYDATGSSAGIRKAIDHGLDFGCSDAPLTDEQLRQAAGVGGEMLHIPLLMGAVVPTYNLPDLPSPVRFNGNVLADIYLGKITTWNDPAIKANNPTLNLPATPITVVRRLDGSGTTYIFTEYLGKVSGAWRQKMKDPMTDPAWPMNPAGQPFGVAAKGNDGVAGKVSEKIGAIGYVEMTYALANSLSVGTVMNQASQYVTPGPESVTAAATAAAAGIPADLRYSLTNAEGPNSYPIVGTSWAVVYVKPAGGKGPEIAKFLTWATRDGQTRVPDLRYAPLPKDLIPRIEPKLARIAAGK